MEFSFIKKILWKLKWLIIIVPLICGTLTFFLIGLKPKQYVSVAQLATGITDQDKVGIVDNDADWLDITNKFANFMAFMEAKEIRSMISYKLAINDLASQNPFRKIEKAKLDKHKFTKEELDAIYKLLVNKFDSLSLLDVNIKSHSRALELIKEYGYDLKSLEKMISINRVQSSDFVKVESKTENSSLSAFVVNTFCEEVVRFNEVSEMRRFGNSITLLKNLMDQKKHEMNLKMDTLRRFKENSNVVNFTIQSESKLNQIATLEQNRNEELKKISSLKSAIEEIKRKIGAAGASAGDEVFQNNKVVNLQDKLQRLSQRFYAGNQKNKRLEDSIHALRAELENRVYLLSRNADNSDLALQTKQELVTKKLNFEIELSMAQSNYSIIQDLLNGLKSNISTFVTDEGKIAELDLEINAARDEYIKIEDKYNKARNVSLNKGGNLRQIELGQPADQPESTHILLFTLVSAILSGMLVVGSGVAIAYLDGSIRTPDRFEELTGIKPIGFIHKINVKNMDLKSLIDYLQREDKNKAILERELQNLRYELIKDKSKIILFSSLGEKQGKSLVLFSLAYSLSKNGSKILIIDTNFKNNSLSILFENYLFQNFMEKLDQGRLLASESMSSDDDINPSKILYSNNEFIKKTGFENIDLIGSSSTSLSPFEIFNDKDFNKLLAVLSAKYDYILLEGSAMNSYSDTKELLEFADKMVIVTDAKYVLSKNDKLALKFVNTQSNKLIGGIINMVDPADLK